MATTKLKAKFIRNYRSPKTGNPVFVYEVSGSADALARYKEVQGDFHRVDEDGKHLYFTTNFVENNVDLLITANGKVVADMSEYDKAASLARQYGGNFGSALATMSAERILGKSGDAQQPMANTAPANIPDMGDI